MSTFSQSIPNFLSGISQQPDNRKRPGQVKDAVNAFPDFALGMLKRPGGKFVSKLHGATPSGKWFEILRDNNEKYIAQYADNVFRVWDLDGDTRMVNMGSNTGVPGTCNTTTVKTASDALNDAVSEVADKLVLLQTAEDTLTQTVAQTKHTVNQLFEVELEPQGINRAYPAINYGMSPQTQFLKTGVLKFPNGDEHFILNGAIESTHPAIAVTIKNCGKGYPAGSTSSLATTTTGNGSGLVLSVVVDGTPETTGTGYGVITSVTIDSAGTGYRTGDIVTLNSTTFTGDVDGVAQFEVQALGKGTQRTNDYPKLASQGVKFYDLMQAVAPTKTAADVTTATTAYNTAKGDYDSAVTTKGSAQTTYDTAVTNCVITSIPSNTLGIIQAGTGLANGTFTAQATATTGSGTNMTVDVTVENGQVTVASINTAGSNYNLNDPITLTAAGFADDVRITTAGSGLVDGPYTGVATTAVTGTGSGMTVDITISGGAVTAAAINSAGSGYRNGDTVSIDGHAGTLLTFSKLELQVARPPYLQGATADDIELLTLNDSTFVLNKKKTVAMTANTTHSSGLDTHRAHVLITLVGNSTEYTVTINGNDYSHTSVSSAANATDIATALATEINTATNTTATATAIGPGLHITDTSAFTISTSSATASEGIYAFTDTIADISRLPLEAKNGYVVQVINSEDIDIDDQYLEFYTDSGNATGPGQWFETTKPGITYQFDPLTMPHRLVSQADLSFTFEAISWDERIIGDDNTNPIPSFVGGTIDHMFFYRNRFGFLSGQNVVLSKAADIFDFWNTTAVTATNDDPIDISVAGKKPVFLHYVQPTSVGLVLYSSNEQFLLSTDSDILAPSSAKVNTMSNYECDPSVEAVSLGISQAFVSKTPLFTRLFELNDIASDTPPLMSDITNIVPELIPASINSFKASAALSLVSLGEVGKSTLYQYRFLNRARDQRVVNSWYKWELTGTLLTQFFDSSTFYAAVKNGTDVYLQSFDVTQANEQGFLSLPTGEKTDVCLDLFNINPHRTYDSNTEKTRVFLPYDAVTGSTLNLLVLGEFGSILTPTIAGSAGSQYVDVDGDYRGKDLIIGYGYDMTIDLPKIFRYSVTGDDVQNDDVSSLIIHRLKFKVGLSGPVDYRVSITGIDPFTKGVTVTLPQQYNLNNVNMQASSTHVVPVFQRNENLAVQIIGNTPFPVSLLGLDWEGKLNQRFYRSG